MFSIIIMHDFTNFEEKSTVPKAQHVASHLCFRALKTIITHCAPMAIDFDFQPSLVGKSTAG